MAVADRAGCWGSERRGGHLGDVGVVVEGDYHRHIRTNHLPHPPEHRPLRVVHVLGSRRAVQRQEDRV